MYFLIKKIKLISAAIIVMVLGVIVIVLYASTFSFFGNYVNRGVVVMEDNSISEYEATMINRNQITLYESEMPEAFTKNFVLREGKKGNFIYAKQNPANANILIADANVLRTSKSNDPSLVFFNKNFDNLKRYSFPKLSDSEDRGIYLTNVFDWIGNNNAFVGIRAWGIGPTRMYVFDRTSEKFIDLNFSVKREAPAVVQYIPDTPYFLMNYCSRENLAGYCDRITYLVSDSKEVKKILELDPSGLTSGTKEGKFFVKQLSDTAEIKLYLIDPSKVF